MNEELVKALVQVIREQINNKNNIKIDDFGVFQPQHIPQKQVQYKNGRVVLRPPNDSITFTPENDLA